MKKERIYIVVSYLIIAIVMFAVSSIPIENEEFLQVDTYLPDVLDATIQDEIIILRNKISEQPISDKVVLIGIDDRTNDVLGVYGKGQWTTRTPFIEQTKAYRNSPPKVVAYDLIFANILGDFSGNFFDKEENIVEIESFIAELKENGGFVNDASKYPNVSKNLGIITGSFRDIELGFNFNHVDEKGTKIVI
ncbi:MAG: hypothetical protein MJH11_05345, partial [Lentisphaeria bacterium]|nr:hypothetical protein [Lentisphaeria bacterium]